MPTSSRYSHHYVSEHRCPLCSRKHQDQTVYCQNCLSDRRIKNRLKANRPTHVNCERCHTRFEINPLGIVPRFCPVCRGLVGKEHIDEWQKQHKQSLKDYHTSYRKNWRHTKPEQYQNSRLRKYGITLVRYLEIFKTQDGKCAICKIPLTDIITGNAKLRRLTHVDHDHSTGKVRGLLCNNCNAGIGLFKDSPEILLSAIHYLRQ